MRMHASFFRELIILPNPCIWSLDTYLNVSPIYHLYILFVEISYQARFCFQKEYPAILFTMLMGFLKRGGFNVHILLPGISKAFTLLVFLQQSCQPVTFKKSIIEIKKPYFEVKKRYFWARSAHHEREVLSAGVQGPKGPGSTQVLGALWCNLSLIFEHYYSKTDHVFINNVCNVELSLSRGGGGGRKKRRKRKKWRKKRKEKNNNNVFLQENTYCRISL